MKIIVTGGRDFDDYDLVVKTLSDLKPTMIIQGGARGADFLALKFAKANSIEYKTYKAEWSVYGKLAGFRRNRLMLIENRDATVVAFKGGKGTENCISTAKHLGFLVLEIS